jgi:hypothetical protein
MFKVMKELYSLKPNAWYYATVGCFAVAMAVDVNTLRRLRKLDREVWRLADNSELGFVYDANSQRIGDIPPVSPTASAEVAEPVLGEEDNASSGD